MHSTISVTLMGSNDVLKDLSVNIYTRALYDMNALYDRNSILCLNSKISVLWSCICVKFRITAPLLLIIDYTILGSKMFQKNLYTKVHARVILKERKFSIDFFKKKKMLRVFGPPAELTGAL